MAETQEQHKQKRVERAEGVVTRAGGYKTCSVVINRLVRHPMYGKFVRRQTRLAVHDPKNEATVGDTIEIQPCRPISCTKRWRMVRIIKKAVLAQQTQA